MHILWYLYVYVHKYHKICTISNIFGKSYIPDPLSDYLGIGGPDAVPLESDGAFEQPEKLPNAYNFLTDLFMAPSEDTIKSFQITEKKRLM